MSLYNIRKYNAQHHQSLYNIRKNNAQHHQVTVLTTEDSPNEGKISESILGACLNQHLKQTNI